MSNYRAKKRLQLTKKRFECLLKKAAQPVSEWKHDQGETVVGEYMPVKVQKVGKNKYKVSTPNQVHAKGTTKAKAKSQARLLNAVEHGWHPTGKKKK